MITLWEAILLGLLQGVTEWIPISSTAHLAILQHFMDINEPIIFDVILHLASVVVVCWVFKERIATLIRGLIQRDRDAWTMAGMLVVGSIPIALLGFLFNSQVKATFNNLLLIGILLIVTSGLLFGSRYPLIKNKQLTWGRALIIGCFQALAILPGVSRSGATIAGGLLLGVERSKVGEFSFFLFIPAILGATILEIPSIGMVSDISALLVASVVTIISGVVTLRLLLAIIQKGYFSYFGWYCLLVGLLTVSIALWG